MADWPDLEETKAFARVDHSDDDDTLTTLLDSAIEFVRKATGKDWDNGDVPERARTAVMALVTTWYDGEGKDGIPRHISSLLHQLRDWREPCDEDAQE